MCPMKKLDGLKPLRGRLGVSPLCRLGDGIGISWREAARNEPLHKALSLKELSLPFNRN